MLYTNKLILVLFAAAMIGCNREAHTLQRDEVSVPPPAAETNVISQTNATSVRIPDVQPTESSLHNPARQRLHYSETISSDGKITESNSAPVTVPMQKTPKTTFNPPPTLTNSF